MVTIGEKIYRLRKQKGFSQEELAFEIGVSRQTISKWEANAMQPNTDNVRTLCEIFNVSANYFFVLDYEKETAMSNELERIEDENDEKIKNRVSVLLYILGIVVVSVLLLISLIVTLITGFTTLTTNTGDAVYITQKIDIWEFLFSAFITLTLLIAEILIILFFVKRKRKCKQLATKCK